MDTPLEHLEMPEATATTIDRLRYLIKLSRRTQADFAALINIDPSNLSKILSGRSPITEGLINRVVVNLGVSKQWLLAGHDVPFPRGEHALEVSDHGERIEVGPVHRGAPVYDIDVTAGRAELSRMFTQERIIGHFDMPGLDPRSPIVRVSGDSMEPRIKDGAYVAIRPISDPSLIAWGQIYVVVLEDYRFVKYVRKHEDRNYVTLHSANPNYDDIEVPRNAILALYMVEVIFNYDIVC